MPGRGGIGDSGDGAVPGWNKLVYLVYRIEVINYCSLVTEQVAAGFQSQQKAVIDEYSFEKPLIESAHSEARKLAHAEWSNRGLGGFRGWCRTDAARYAKQFVQAPKLNPNLNPNPAP